MHVSVLGPDGVAVSLTSTVNLLFGAQVMDRATGIILNDEMVRAIWYRYFLVYCALNGVVNLKGRFLNPGSIERFWHAPIPLQLHT